MNFHYVARIVRHHMYNALLCTCTKVRSCLNNCTHNLVCEGSEFLRYFLSISNVASKVVELSDY
jgi:hypothetical protein